MLLLQRLLQPPPPLDTPLLLQQNESMKETGSVGSEAYSGISSGGGGGSRICKFFLPFLDLFAKVRASRGGAPPTTPPEYAPVWVEACTEEF